MIQNILMLAIAVAMIVMALSFFVLLWNIFSERNYYRRNYLLSLNHQAQAEELQRQLAEAIEETNRLRGENARLTTANSRQATTIARLQDVIGASQSGSSRTGSRAAR